MTFADSLKRFRHDFGLTQRQVADSLELQESAYQRYEHGKTLPSIAVVTKLADAYDVSLDYLVGRTDTPNLYVVGENPPITSDDFLNNIILDARKNHRERLSKSKGNVPEPAIEYADNLLRHYHKALIDKLQQAGVNF